MNIINIYELNIEKSGYKQKNYDYFKNNYCNELITLVERHNFLKFVFKQNMKVKMIKMSRRMSY